MIHNRPVSYTAAVVLWIALLTFMRTTTRLLTNAAQ